MRVRVRVCVRARARAHNRTRVRVQESSDTQHKALNMWKGLQEHVKNMPGRRLRVGCTWWVFFFSRPAGARTQESWLSTMLLH